MIESKSIYSYLVPKFIRKPLNDLMIKKTILNYYDCLLPNQISNEERSALEFLRLNKLCVFPYSFQNNYVRKDIVVLLDKYLGLKYVILDGKRLYFKKASSFRGVKRNFNALRIEQDINSPHRYLTESFNVNENDILVDVGTAEGNLPLDVIEKAKKIYMFETNPKWIEALEATFKPWKEKVVIVNKFVSDKSDENHVTLDEYFEGKEPFTFLKIDAEGSEASVLEGAKKAISSSQKLKIAICCYHKPKDAEEFEKYFKTNNFSVAFAKGLMIFEEPKNFFPPYLRKGVLRASR